MSLHKVYCFCLGLLVFSYNLLAQQPRLVLPIGHNNIIYSASFCPDDKKIATASYDNTAKIWDAKTGQLLADISGHSELVHSAIFSFDGKKILTASEDSTAKIWDAESTILLLNFNQYPQSVISADFSFDDKMILMVYRDNTAKIWDAETGKLISNLTGHSESITSASFSKDNKKILTASWDSTSKIWDARTGKLLAILTGHSSTVYSARFSPDGGKIVTASNDSYAKIWNAETGKLLIDLNGHTSCVNSANFSPDGKKIVTASDDNYLKIWDTESGKLLLDIKGHNDKINAANFSPDGKKIVTFSRDKICKLWDAETGNLLVELKGHSADLNSASFSSNGEKIVTASNDMTAKIWSIKTGKIMADLNGHSSAVWSANFSPDGKMIVSTSGDNTAKLWLLETGILTAQFPLYPWINSANLSPDGKKIITTSLEYSPKIWDAISAKPLITLNGHLDKVNWASFSPDGRTVATTSNDKTSKIWDAETGKLLVELTGHWYHVRLANFSPDGKKIVTTSSDKTAKIWDVKSGKLLADLAAHKDVVNSANFSLDGKMIVTSAFDNSLKIWDVETGRLLIDIATDARDAYFSPDGKTLVNSSWYDDMPKIWDVVSGNLLSELKGHSRSITSIGFSQDGKKIVTASWDRTIKIWDAATGKILSNLVGHSADVNSAKFSLNGKIIISASNDNTIKIWDASSGKLKGSFYAVDSSDYICMIPSGYYKCTQGAAKLLHYVSKDLKVITFEQLDVKYNRPDKVLEAIGNSDTALIKSYRKAWEKRIKKLGIDTTAFKDGYSVPEADFTNRDVIEYEQKTGTLKLTIKGNDSTYKLDRFNIWVNETPIFGQRGISIRKKNINDLDTTITIKLSQGENRIETSITNVNGTESYRMPLIVNYTPAIRQKEMIRFIGIGIDQFKDDKYNLEYSTKDIRDLSLKLKEKYGNDISIDTLFNENVTVSNVKQLKNKLLQTTENDKVIISYSGHGLLSKEYDYYLSTYAVNFNKPEENGLSYDELENLLDSIPARKKLMLIDACHSGEVDKEEGIEMNKMSDSLGLSKGIIIDGSTTQTQQLGLKSSFELMQSLFVNVGKSTGATIISAAAGNQFALERGDLKNGVFTYSLLEAMNTHTTLKISELKKIVGERVEQLTNGMQKPTSRNENITTDWSIW